MKEKGFTRLLQAFLYAAAACYGAALVYIVLLKNGLSFSGRCLELTPFAFIGDFIRKETSLDVLLKNVLGNLAIFIPLGVLLPCLFRKLNLLKTVLIGFLVSLSFELLQLAFGIGVTDIDDLLLNTLGAFIGGVLYFAAFRRFKKSWGPALASLLFLAFFGCCGLLALWLYHPSSFPMTVEYENREAVFGETDPDSADLGGYCLGLANGSLLLREYGENNETVENAYPLSEDVKIILEWKRWQYSPNGNVQKMFLRYELSDAETAQALIEEKGGAFGDI